jgi:hypothetical protein
MLLRKQATTVLGKRRKETKRKTQTQRKEMNVTALVAVSWLYGRAGGRALRHYCSHVASMKPKHGMSVSMQGMLAILAMLTKVLSLDFQLRGRETLAQNIIDLKLYITMTL